MLGNFLLSLSFLGVGWWLKSRISRREPRAKVLPREKPLTAGIPGEISVVSYNLLADCLVLNNSTSAYAYVNSLHLCWEYRWNLLQEEFATFGTDFLCLQEVEKARWPEICSYMASLGYEGMRQNPKKNFMSVCTAVFYKRERFKVVWAEHRSRAMGLALSYLDIGGEEKVIYIINWHLEGHPQKPRERISQMDSILRRMASRQGSAAESCDVIIAGDFNSTRWNSPWHLMFRGRLEAMTTEAHLPNVSVTDKTVAHPYALQDVYLKAKWLPEFTTRAPRRRSEVDFIWCSRHMNVEAVMQPAKNRDVSLIDRTCLPNRLHPSDHLPIGAVLTSGDPAQNGSNPQ